jgi:hypothetical protein
MTVTLTAPAEGKQPGEKYTGPREAWLLAEGYATRKGYSGPGLANSGPTTVKPEKDPTLADNREKPGELNHATASALPYGGTNDGVVLRDDEEEQAPAEASPAPEGVESEEEPKGKAQDINEPHGDSAEVPKA